MSKFVVYLKVKPFVRQWLENAYGSPVTFPPQSVENATIRRFTAKQPGNYLPSHCADDVAIAIPDSKAKDPLVYNYLGERGKGAVIECIEDNFNRNMWSELNDLSDVGCSVMSAIYAWCENHGIDIDYGYTIRQRYYRIRDAYRKKNVDLRRRKHFSGSDFD